MKRLLLTVTIIVLLVLCTISCQEHQDIHKESNSWQGIDETNLNSLIGEVSIATSTIDSSSSDVSSNDIAPSKPSISESFTSEPFLEQTAPYSGLPAINSDLAFIHYISNDTTFYKGDSDTVVFPASITKLWTAYVALYLQK